MSIVNGPKIGTMVSAANGDTYGDGERHQFRSWQALVQANVKSTTLATPPGSPSNGDTYIVAAAPTGAWTGQAGNIAYWAVDAQDGPSITPNIATGAWEFYTPLAGWIVYDQNSGARYQFNGTNWLLASALKAVVVPAVGVVTCNPALANSFRVNVNAAVTSVIISNGIADGQEITVEFVQDATGHSVTGFAANIHGVGYLSAPALTAVVLVPSAAALSVSAQRYAWDTTNTVWYAVAAGVAGM